MGRKTLSISLVIFLLILPWQVMGQDEDLAFSLNSPQATIKTHLLYLQEDTYYPNIAGEVFYEEHLNGKDREELAIKLKQFFDGEGYYIDLDEIPASPDYYDSTTNKALYTPIPNEPRIYVQKIEGKWYYSRRTVNSIEELHKEVFPFGTDKLLTWLPKLGQQDVLGLRVWQLISLLILILISYLIHRVLTLVLGRIFIRVLLRFGYKKLARQIVLPIAKPISYVLIFIFLTEMVPVLQLPITMNRYVMIILKAAGPIFITVFFYRIVDIISLYLEGVAERTKNTLDDMLVPLVRKALKTFVIVAGGLFILHNLGQNVMALVAGLSIGGLALALAAQDTIKNFFGSLMIFVDKPFQVGDWITSGDVDGTVEEVGFRSTRVRTFRNSLVYVPNGVITARTIDNHGERKYRRFYTTIAVTYDTPPDLVEIFIEGLRSIVKDHPDTRKDYYEIHLNDFADSSLNIMFYIFFKVPSWSEELRARHEIMLSVIQLAEKLGINFAFPTRTLHMENFPGKPSLSPKYEPADKVKVAMEKFLKAKKK